MPTVHSDLHICHRRSAVIRGFVRANFSVIFALRFQFFRFELTDPPMKSNSNHLFLVIAFIKVNMRPISKRNNNQDLGHY